MTLAAIGHLIGQTRRAKGLTLRGLADAAGIGRSTLAALEAGKLAELGFSKIARVCDALGLVLEARAPLLPAPLMPHRHLTDAAGRELSKAAIEDILLNGDFAAWRALVKVLRTSGSAALAQRIRSVATALEQQDARARAFATLLPELLGGSADAARPA